VFSGLIHSVAIVLCSWKSHAHVRMGFWEKSMWHRKKKRRKIIPNIEDTLFQSNAQGQRTHSARTNIVDTSFRSNAQGQRTHSAWTNFSKAKTVWHDQSNWQLYPWPLPFYHPNIIVYCIPLYLNISHVVLSCHICYTKHARVVSLVKKITWINVQL
jgi:hypothetical protein